MSSLHHLRRRIARLESTVPTGPTPSQIREIADALDRCMLGIASGSLEGNGTMVADVPMPFLASNYEIQNAAARFDAMIANYFARAHAVPESAK
jgi:hypothetical protein